ncbi:hypothetical protein [Ochrobactrum sp. AN78]|uniref:hypothetical protein n=1 Tax=Ochrobactrum sp. AN78 TaxID=3039853 RepID=UPI002989BCDC|nr:hypothetical protein [Ochrobactrum sp. AN78]MDH7790194.1 hypothetical protein [Ochrobactrum sp. AN78]
MEVNYENIRKERCRGKMQVMEPESERIDAPFNDMARAVPLKYSFSIEGHRHSYHLTALVPLYGEGFCRRFETAWRKSASFRSGATSDNYFKAARKAFILIARKGAVEPDTPCGLILGGFRDRESWTPSIKEWGAILEEMAASILDLRDHSFIENGTPESRNKKFESLRCALRWLSSQGLIPEVELEGRRIREEFGAASKCLATVKFEAGRLDVSGASLSDAANKFSICNREMLEEIRKCLWLELKENIDLYEEGSRLMRDPSIPDVSDFESVLRNYTDQKIRDKIVQREIKFNRSQILGMALKIYKRSSIEKRCISRKADLFMRSVIRYDEAQPYYEATIKSLNAAYHIILIDLGANCQPVDDIAFDCFSGGPQRGKIKVRSLHLIKNRSNGRVVPGSLREDLSERELYLATKTVPDRPSGVMIINMWKMLTHSMRSEAGPAMERLWVWRKPGATKVETSLVSMSSERWPAFLERQKKNEMFGGLRIQRRHIRTAVRNLKGEDGDPDIAVDRALMGHLSTKTTFQYLSEGAVRSLLESKIRAFIEAWEAVSVQDIDAAARFLGIPQAELFRRAQLGIANGLAALSTRVLQRRSKIKVGSAENLSDAAQEFSVSISSMTNLDLARRALREQCLLMVNTNPQRFVRKWLPWMAIVEGYCERLEQSRFRLQFSKVCNDVEKKLLAGQLRTPLLW